MTLTSDSPSAHPAREVAGVKAAWWWVSGKVSSMQIFGVFPAKMGSLVNIALSPVRVAGRRARHMAKATDRERDDRVNDD